MLKSFLKFILFYNFSIFILQTVSTQKLTHFSELQFGASAFTLTLLYLQLPSFLPSFSRTILLEWKYKVGIIFSNVMFACGMFECKVSIWLWHKSPIIYGRFLLTSQSYLYGNLLESFCSKLHFIFQCMWGKLSANGALAKNTVSIDRYLIRLLTSTLNSASVVSEHYEWKVFVPAFKS